MQHVRVTALTLPSPRFVAAAAIGACLMACAGCSTTPGVVFDTSGGTHEWPPPPDAPRIRYVGQLKGAVDLKPAKSGIDSLGESLFGASPAPEGFLSPMAVCTDGGDKVFVADSNAHVVHVMDLKTRAYKRIAPTGKDEQLGLPVALAYDPSGRLLVADSLGGKLVIFDLSGKRLGAIGTGVLQRPCGLLVDPATRQIYVVDSAAHQIVVLSPDGLEQGRIGRRGSEPGEFNYPTNIARDSAGRLYVSDSLNFRVQVFGPKLEFIREIGRKGDMPGYFAQPKGLALDPEGHLYVVDANFEAVQLFDSSGAVLMSFGREGKGPGEFWLPAGIFIDSHARIWIADSYNRRVQVFDYLPEVKQP